MGFARLSTIKTNKYIQWSTTSENVQLIESSLQSPPHSKTVATVWIVASPTASRYASDVLLLLVVATVVSLLLLSLLK